MYSPFSLTGDNSNSINGVGIFCLTAHYSLNTGDFGDIKFVFTKIMHEVTASSV